MDNLKELRRYYGITQRQAAESVGVSLRSYKSYENDEDKKGTIKYNYIYQTLMEQNHLDETHGTLSLIQISDTCKDIFQQYDVNYCYLFGSYAKNTATQESDVDLLVSTNTKGLKYFEMVEELRRNLHKRVDVLSTAQLKDNYDLVLEILKDGIKIYGQHQE